LIDWFGRASAAAGGRPGEGDSVAKKIGDSTLREFALVGARAKYAALQAELASLVAAFPELARSRGARKAKAPGRKRGRKKPMTAAERKAVSERMQKYWAERRAGKK
jgi:hypothetical protein